MPIAAEFPSLASALQASLESRIRGQSQSIRLLLGALFAGGHVLIEDLPGTGKTTLAKTLAHSISAKFSRVQFTPDLMPSDIVGSTVYNPKSLSFDFHPGPVFCNLLLADEINRASPRTQSALLEAMEERQASVDGSSKPLPNPFFVVATENPVDMHGTYPLPEAQLDRFMIKLPLGGIPETDEISILLGKASGELDSPVSPVLSIGDLIAMQARAKSIHVSPSVAAYIVALARKTRAHEAVQMGVSTRGAVALMRLSQSLALLRGSEFVLPEDVQAAAPSCLSHRIVLREGSRFSGPTPASIIEEAIRSVSAPV